MTAATSGAEAIECERKYSGVGTGRLPDLDRIAGVVATSVQRTTLTATYYDTPELRLLGAGITLRRRLGGADEGWHLKLPIDADARTELRLPLAAGSNPPEAFTNLVAARVRTASLEPVATIETERESHRLLGADNSMLAEVVLDQVRGCAATAGAHPIEWREIEVEWSPKAKALLVELERRLSAVGARRVSERNKLSRVLVSPARGPATKPKDCSGALGTYLNAQCEAIAASDLSFRRGGADAVHEIRVAMRRARSALTVIDEVVGDDVHTQLIDELRWLGRELAAARDVEVQRERLSALLSTIDRQSLGAPVRERVAAHFTARDAIEHSRATDALNSARYFQLLDVLNQAAASFVLPARSNAAIDDALVRIRHRISKRIARVSKTKDRPEREVAAHRARKGVKLMRYALEVTRPLAERAVDTAISGLSELQGLLGDHQDSVVARQELLALRREAELAGEETAVYGVLYQQEEDLSAALLARLPRAWKHAEKVCRKVKVRR